MAADKIRVGVIFTEWPPGKTLAESQDMAERPRRQKVQHEASNQGRELAVPRT